ncbi:hypothetical protein CR205_02535 [Alteribacter lacisalsi]|uniref:DUF4190 domain-containing protein n=1 Tax=Alteribacter lacisalsi TaxID=2045244 RepID=A0A2W0H6J9_9BACI|nr:DUF4190 domain-containing protein [Alteribacter lacisalsi]PYZ97493.1 hypothetical protein CR205_02535 [Alteribacter lacisalsi]
MQKHRPRSGTLLFFAVGNGSDALVQKERKNRKAVWSLVLGILSLVLPYMGLLAGVAGIFTANRALREIEAGRGSGKYVAFAGKLCSIGGIIAYTVVSLVMIASFFT